MSLEEISKKINISRTTLYKVINNKGYVKDSTKKIVEDALRKYKYVPNLNARDLARHCRHTIGYVGMDYSASYFFTMTKWGLKRALDASTERPEALEAGDFILAGITTKELLNATDMAIEMKQKGVLGKPCPDYVDETVSMKVVRIIQGYVNVVNKMVWRKDQ